MVEALDALDLSVDPERLTSSVRRSILEISASIEAYGALKAAELKPIIRHAAMKQTHRTYSGGSLPQTAVANLLIFLFGRSVTEVYMNSEGRQEELVRRDAVEGAGGTCTASLDSVAEEAGNGAGDEISVHSVDMSKTSDEAKLMEMFSRFLATKGEGGVKILANRPPLVGQQISGAATGSTNLGAAALATRGDSSDFDTKKGGAMAKFSGTVPQSLAASSEEEDSIVRHTRRKNWCHQPRAPPQCNS